jgi:hypothetical protein
VARSLGLLELAHRVIREEAPALLVEGRLHALAGAVHALAALRADRRGPRAPRTLTP